jgi:hypothetical protein
MKHKSDSGDWMSIGIESWSLGEDAMAVIGLRLAKIATGGSSAIREAIRMVTEKVEATAHLQFALMTGALGSNPKAIAHNALRYSSKKVQANRRRLGAERQSRRHKRS